MSGLTVPEDSRLSKSVATRLTKYGWDTREMEKFHSARKVYVTAVGPREALAYLHLGMNIDQQQSVAVFQVAYWDEGRNLLSGFYPPLLRSDVREFEASLKAFSATVDNEVAKTYAMKLLGVLR